MSETESLESTSSEVPERKSPLVDRVVKPFTRRFGQYAAPLVLTVLAACSKAENQADITVRSQPPSEKPTATATIEGLPLATTIPTATPTAEITPITKGVETQTPQPTPSSTPEPAPTASSTPEQSKPKSNWVIEVDPKLSRISPQIIEEDKAVIQSIIQKFPQVGSLKIILTQGHSEEFKVGTQEIVLGRDYEHFAKTPETLKFAVAHGVTHYLDPELNGQALSAFLTEQQMDELKKMREQALSDPFWGRDYPDLEKIFTPDKNITSHALESSRTYTPEQLATWSDLYPDAVWIGLRGSEEVSRTQLFRPIMIKEMLAIENYAKEATGVSDVQSILDFLEKPEIAAKLEPLAAQNPLFAKALELVKTKKDLFTSKNTVWPSLAPTAVYLQGKYTNDYWEALPVYIEMVSAEAYLEGNRDFISLLSKEERYLSSIDQNLNWLKKKADKEKFAELGVATIIFGMKTPLSPIFENLASASKSR